MKPHIRWSGFWGGWACSLPGGRPNQPYGVGDTPSEAYTNWLHDCRTTEKRPALMAWLGVDLGGRA